MGSGASKRLKGSVQAACDVLGRVFGGGYADILLDAALDRVAPESRALVTETVYGVLRHHGRIDLVIDSVSKIKTKKMETGVLLALRIGVYRLLFLSGVPAYAAIDESVKLVKRGGGEKRTGFVNAVLRKVDSTGGPLKVPDIEKIGREGVGYAALYYSHPEWLVRRWASRYGPEGAVRLLETNLTPPPRTIRVNTLVTSKEALVRELARSGFTAAATEYSPVALRVTGSGPLPLARAPGNPGYYIADEASQLVAYLLGPGPGETVLDACAAPGGKSSQIGALMENSGALYAMEKSPARARVLGATLRVQGVSCALVIIADAGASLCFKDPAFDAILVDAPCSGLGVLGRSPDIKLRREEADLGELAKIQTRLLENLGGYLKIGGRMVYSVCSLEPEETVEVVEGFLERHPGFALANAKDTLPKGCGPLVDGRGFLRTVAHLHGTDGFFAARLEKTG